VPDGGAVTVIDIDLAQLTLDIPASTLVEAHSVTATVTRSFVTSQPLLVTLVASSASQVSLPATVLIPANAASAKFTLTATDDQVPEAAASIGFAASATACQDGTDSLLVQDDDLPTLALSLNRQAISESAGNSALTGTVSRAVVTSQPLTVLIDT